jgi:hypothetical protein
MTATSLITPAGLARLAGVAALFVIPVMIEPANARPQPKPARLDLSVRPGDLRSMPAASLPVLGEPERAVEASMLAPTDPVAEIDQVRRTEIPDRRRAQSGLEFGDSNLIQELLENKTIPLFRVTVEPPF